MSFWLFRLCLSKIRTAIRANSNETLVLQISVKCHRGCCPSDFVVLRGCRPCKPPDNAIKVVGHLILLPGGGGSLVSTTLPENVIRVVGSCCWPSDIVACRGESLASTGLPDWKVVACLFSCKFCQGRCHIHIEILRVTRKTQFCLKSEKRGWCYGVHRHNASCC